MSRDLKLFVVDTGPLITLAVAHSLDYLLYIDADVVIPDAVLHESIRDAARLGVQDIIDWVKANRTRIDIAATKAYELYDLARVTAPMLREPDLGERAAVEVIEEPDRLQNSERVFYFVRKRLFSGRSSYVIVSGSWRSAHSTFSVSRRPNSGFNRPNRCLNWRRRPAAHPPAS
jgi:hypothetical protein